MEAVLADKCLPEILSLYEDLKKHRRDIHSHPDLGFDTERTLAKTEEFLKSHGVTKNIYKDLVKGCLFVLIEGTRPGKTIGLRADIDALGMDDKVQQPWCSKIEGRAHACGHDGHQTWLLGACTYLANHNDFPGKVLCIFQAAEEIGKGAMAIVDAGILEKFDVKEIYAAHDEPFLEKGHFGFKVGPLQAASDTFKITFTGIGTHGGRPHKGVDCLPALCEAYQAIQTIVSRRVDPMESAVVSACFMNAGKVGTFNVQPPEGCMGGTVRTFLPEVRDLVEENIKRMAKGVAMAHGLDVKVDYVRLISAVNNNKECTEAGIKVALDLIGPENVVAEMRPFMTSEDFSYYQEKIPGAIMRVGIADENHTNSLHNPSFDFNDEVLPIASTLIVKIALSRLNKLAAG